MRKRLLGFDIGGTKCTVVLGETDGPDLHIIDREVFPTPRGPEAALALLADGGRKLLDRSPCCLDGIGISCGGPLDSRHGILLSPPNLPGWDAVPICKHFASVFGVSAHLQNDANACAFAEWKWGAGKGVANMVFLTFGTGMGAGLILDGRLYSGTNDFAGEIGHLRMSDDGPIGYGKRGSFEGFCSGAGILQIANECGLKVADARQVFELAKEGSAAAWKVVETSARQLGRGLAVIVDVLNPELIVIGSIFARQRDALWPLAKQTLQAEALAGAVNVCKVVPSALGEHIGEWAALSVAKQECISDDMKAL